MATENPNLPAPEEQVSDAAEDVQTVTSEVTSEVPETEASAAAEAEPVVETPAAEEPETEKSVAGTPAAEVPVAEAPAAEEPQPVSDDVSTIYAWGSGISSIRSIRISFRVRISPAV